MTGLMSCSVSANILLGSEVITRAALVMARNDAPCIRIRGGSSATDEGFVDCPDNIAESSSEVVTNGAAKDGKKEVWMGEESIDWDADLEVTFVTFDLIDAESSVLGMGLGSVGVRD